MNNIKYLRSGNKLTIEVDLSGEAVPSASGKTLVLASSRGNHKVEGGFGLPDIFVGLNVFQYPPRGK